MMVGGMIKGMYGSVSSSGRVLAPVALILVLVAPRLGAQRVDTLTLRVRVADTVGHPVVGAEVSIVQGLKDVRASGVTNDVGRSNLRLPRPSGSIEVVVRRIGYTRGGTFLTPVLDTATASVTLYPAAQALEGVKVTAQEDIKRRAYHVDADEIANSSRPIFDGMDVLLKLKPDIVYGRVEGCAVENVWVNGKRIFDVAIDPMVAARQPHRPDPRMRTNYGPLPAPKLSRAGLAEVWTILASIKPEHIAEMNFADCMDNTVDKLHAQNALFVVLKPGIGFEPGLGSYVIDDKPKPAARATALPAYRNRLLGLFDETTGDALAGASITDSTSGTTAVTTSTGTVTLAFLSDGAHTLHVTKPGYSDTSVAIRIEPRDTIPITLVLKRGP